MVENPVQTALSEVPADATEATKLAAALLYEVDECTASDLAEAVGCTRTYATNVLSDLADLDLARRTDGPDTGAPGRNPTLYVAHRMHGGEADVPMRVVKDRVVSTLARFHYQQSLSAAKTKHPRRELPECSVARIRTALRQLRHDGAVEIANPDAESGYYYRLPGADQHVPFRAGRAEA